MMKRFVDVVFASFGLLFLSPLFLLVAVIIKIDSKGPVFFIQSRVGMNFKLFNLYKFRTMIPGAPQKGLLVTAGGDTRVTKVGRFLRKTKIDELPQLINVIKGDMSLVGPRPEMSKYVEMYRDEYRKILEVRPGITDISSLKYSNEELVLKNKDDVENFYIKVLLPEKIKLAEEYVDKSSFLFDLKLIFLTIFKLIQKI